MLTNNNFRDFEFVFVVECSLTRVVLLYFVLYCYTSIVRTYINKVRWNAPNRFLDTDIVS